MKKLSALLLAFAMMLTMLSVASADDVQVIRMWSNDQHDQSVIKEKIEAFNATIGKENGIAVEYTVYGSDYYSTLDVAVTSKEGPDIFKCNKIGNYAEAGYILPWEKIPALSTLVERFSSYNAPGYGEFFGQTYSVPIRVTTYGIACKISQPAGTGHGDGPWSGAMCLSVAPIGISPDRIADPAHIHGKQGCT